MIETGLPINPEAPISVVPPPESTQKVEVDPNSTRLAQNEQDYVNAHKGTKKGLEARYVDDRSGYDKVQKQLNDFKDRRGVVATIENGDDPFSNESMRQHIEDQVKLQVDKLFTNPEKNKIAAEYIKSSIELFAKAQTEGDIPKDLSLTDVYRYIVDEVTNVAYQDIAASENTLGDHGIRHLWGHNVRMAEICLDEVATHGTPVKAIDKIMVRRIMTDHDLGYAMDPVRHAAASKNFAGEDGGHNVLAAKFARERGVDKDHPINKILSKDQQELIHVGILKHDSSEINFAIGANCTREQTDKNIESAIHLADNTHAFETKLPEILYGHPQTLEYMRLMKVAQDIGDSELLDTLRTDLIKSIQDRTDLHEDDKDALKNAAGLITPEGAKFTVPRICGTDPTIQIDASGVATITVNESEIHREVMQTFGQREITQMRKFAKDLTGVNPDQQPEQLDGQIEVKSQNGRVIIHLEVGNAVHEGKPQTDYEKQISELIKNTQFQEYLIKEHQQALLQSLLNQTTDSDGIAQSIVLRKELLTNYLQSKHDRTDKGSATI